MSEERTTLEEEIGEFFRKGFREQSEIMERYPSHTTAEGKSTEQIHRWLEGDWTGVEGTHQKAPTSGSQRLLMTGIGRRRTQNGED